MFFSHLDFIDVEQPEIIGCSCRRVNGGDVDGNGLRAFLVVSVRLDGRTTFVDLQADFRPRVIDGIFTAEILSVFCLAERERETDSPDLLDRIASAIESYRSAVSAG